ncbi:MAG: hypothetical protein EA369_02245 [Bradymonadales bacterium]|nr:MAG: hypothetical protein EA369_02245 [Bradymonadales bacterium]
MCRSLAKKDFEVYLIAAAHDDSEIDGVKIVAIKKWPNRILRMSLSPIELLWKALKLKASIYHFHDPELIPVGIALRLLGKRVVYDVHEDYVSSISQKAYLYPLIPLNPRNA